MRLKNLLLLAAASFFSSCVSDKEEGPVVSDATLYSMAKNESSFQFYKNNPDTLTADVESSHFFYIRVRLNPKARTAMNDSLSGMIVQEFPDESMIVKEVYDAKGGPLQRYAIMYKLKNAANSSYGWVWAELKADGTPAFSASSKGSQCVNCHAAGISQDMVRTFALH